MVVGPVMEHDTSNMGVVYNVAVDVEHAMHETRDGPHRLRGVGVSDPEKPIE